MKRILLVLFSVFLTSQFFAQSGDSTIMMSFRQRALSSFTAEAPELTGLYTLIDSVMTSNNKAFRSSYDSIISDSAFVLTVKAPLSMFDQHFAFERAGRQPQSMESLRAAMNGFLKYELPAAFHLPLFEYMHQRFVEAGDFQSALVSLEQTDKSLRARLDLQKERLVFVTDSLNNAIVQLEKSKSAENEKISQELKLWMIAAGFAAFVAMLLLVIWLVSRSSARKKLIAMIEKGSDKSETEALTRKISDLKTEAQEFRKTAQLTIDRLNTMDESRRVVLTSLKQLNSEIGYGLGEVKQQCEQGKSAMPPATYMAIQNAATRLGNTVTTRVEQISQQLK